MDTVATWIACVLLYLLSISTITCSVYTIYLFVCRPKQRTSFTGICTTRSVFHLSNVAVLGPVCGTITLVSAISGWEMSTSLAKVSQISWYALPPIEAILSIKRQMAVSFPHTYGCVFTPMNVKYLMLVWSSTAFAFWVWRLAEGCFVYFATRSLHLEYSSQECEDFDVFIAKYVMIPLQILSIALNFLTLYIILYSRKKKSMNNLKKFKQRINYRLCLILAIQNIFWLASTLSWLPQPNSRSMCIPKKKESGATTPMKKKGPMPGSKGLPPEMSKSNSSLLKLSEQEKKPDTAKGAPKVAEKAHKKGTKPPAKEKEPTTKKQDPTQNYSSMADTAVAPAQPRKNNTKPKWPERSRGWQEKTRRSRLDPSSNRSIYFTVVTEQFENAQAVPLSYDLKKALNNRPSSYAFESEEEDEDDTLAFVGHEMPTIIFPPLAVPQEPEVARPKRYVLQHTQED